jgi:plastocyanin
VGRALIAGVVLAVAATISPAIVGSQDLAVTGRVAVASQGKKPPDLANVVVTLKPAGGAEAVPPRATATRPRVRMVQRNKRFEPHLLAVPVGTVIEFPNLDPFFHNVFSLFEGKRFDLGLYEAGTTRSAPFTRPGVCYIFCNIHPEMSAVIVVVDTPYYAVTNAAGGFTIAGVPPGRYQLTAWHERYKAARPGDLPREITIAAGSASGALETIEMVDPGGTIAPHQNKYGHDYVPPPPGSPIYK